MKNVFLLLSFIAILFVSGCGGGGSTSTPTVTAPAAPTGVTTATANTQLTPTWAAVTGATSYNVYYRTTAGVTIANGAKVANAISGTPITGLVNGTPYYVVVTAVNAAGESALSSEVSATPAFSAPTGVTAAAGNTKITPSWTAVTGATSYNIYYSTAAGIAIPNRTKITGATSGAPITGLTNGTTYYVVVMAVNASGESALSAEVRVTPVAFPPIGVFAISGAGQVTISWSPVTGATSYNIYWGTTTGVTTASTKISGVTSPYIHTGLISGSTYYYRVRANNSGLSDEVFSFLYTVNPRSLGATGSMTIPRAYHSATLLPNGKVLVTGGTDGSGVPTSSSEIYDPATGLFTVTGSMSTARTYHTAILLPNGKVLVTGGATWSIASPTTIPLSNAEIYDPSTGLFTSVGNILIARLVPTLTLLPNGQVLMAGGKSQAIDAGFIASAELYDPATGLFTATGSMSTPRTYFTATLLLNGTVLVAGGKCLCWPNLKSAEIYDPATGLFTAATGSMPYPSAAHSATLLPNGTVLFAGGYDGISSVTPNAGAQIYDPATGLFTATGSMAGAQKGHNATLLPNGKVLVGGGESNLGYSAYFEIYDPATGLFTSTLQQTVYTYQTSTLLPNGKVLVTGGLDPASPFRTPVAAAYLFY